MYACFCMYVYLCVCVCVHMWVCVCYHMCGDQMAISKTDSLCCFHIAYALSACLSQGCLCLLSTCGALRSQMLTLCVGLLHGFWGTHIQFLTLVCQALRPTKPFLQPSSSFNDGECTTQEVERSVSWVEPGTDELSDPRTCGAQLCKDHSNCSHLGELITIISKCQQHHNDSAHHYVCVGGSWL